MKLPLERIERAGLGLVVVAGLGLTLLPIVGAASPADLVAESEPAPLEASATASGILSARPSGDDVFTDETIQSPSRLIATLTTGTQPLLVAFSASPSELLSRQPNNPHRPRKGRTAPVLPTPTTTIPVSTSTTEATTTTNPTTTTTTVLTTTTVSPTTTTTKATDSNPTSYPGRPATGKVYWGAAVGSNTDPTVRHEIPAGAPLSVRRTFFQWSQRTGYMINIVKDDIASGRLPWVSIKTPSWQAMADGLHNAEIDEMLKALDAVAGPVWLTVHHEPEGGGGVNSPDDAAGPVGHLAMNRQVRLRMQALGVDNVALAPILMDWTWESSSGRDPNEWWDGSVYDFIGVDHYVCYSNAASCEHDSLLNSTWTKVKAWAAAKGVDVAVGEWGMRGTDEDARTRILSWYASAASSSGAGRVVALAAFDSDQNVPSSYYLMGTQLEEFWNLLKSPSTAQIP